MSLFDGLYGYEVLLLVLGALFFVLLAGLLAAQILRGKPYGSLLFFFAVPIAMMGYSHIQSIQFKDGTISIENAATQLQANPTNSALRANLEKQVNNLANRPTSDPVDLTRIATAEFALGNHAAAKTTLDKAMQYGPAPPQAQQLQQRIKLDQKLTSLSAQLEQHPSDPATKQKLEEAVSQANQLHIASPVLLTHLAGAQAALGDRKQAQALADTALKIKPDLAAARQLQSDGGKPQ